MENKINITTIIESKKELKGTIHLDKHIKIYCWVPQNERAKAGVAILLNKKWKGKIPSYTWIKRGLATIKCEINRGYLTIIAAYRPERGIKQETLCSIIIYKKLWIVTSKFMWLSVWL